MARERIVKNYLQGRRGDQHGYSAKVSSPPCRQSEVHRCSKKLSRSMRGIRGSPRPPTDRTATQGEGRARGMRGALEVQTERERGGQGFNEFDRIPSDDEEEGQGFLDFYD